MQACYFIPHAPPKQSKKQESRVKQKQPKATSTTTEWGRGGEAGKKSEFKTECKTE